MSLLSTAKIVYLPSTSKPGTKFNILTIPNPRTSKPQNLLLHGDQLYELSSLSHENPHLSSQFQPPTTKKDQKPVRSLVIENLTDENEGLILETSELIISSVFAFEYVLIWWFNKQKQISTRFQTLDALIDSIEDDIANINQLPADLVSNSLKQICENLEENDELFYKYSEAKMLHYLQSKVTKINEAFPTTILEKLIKPSLYPIDINKSIPEEILSSSKTYHSIYILSSYLLPSVQSLLLAKYDFKELNQYIDNLKQERIKRKLVEDSVNDLNQLNTQNKRKNNGNSSAPPKKKSAAAKNL